MWLQKRDPANTLVFPRISQLPDMEPITLSLFRILTMTKWREMTPEPCVCNSVLSLTLFFQHPCPGAINPHDSQRYAPVTSDTG
ncbi:Uncharacterized protein DAT39_011394 [Clarias magur]|uniref:Uncharacterized protein n=1 Tax=Clarias magur TaxID=1594786 RepID=A0A8J4X2Q5_CLAMG|nr:Uncharacterized protein DAT39_011394 [Clarias magur]